MFPPRTKRFILKLLVSVFVSDIRTIYRQYLKTRIVSKKMKHLLRTVTPANIQEAQLQLIAERIGEQQKLIYLLCEKGFQNNMDVRNVDLSARKIQKQLDSIERELLQLLRYTK